MPLTISNRVRTAAALAFTLAAGGAFAQRYPPPEPPPLTAGPCKPTKKDPCPPPATPAPPAAEAFPFPGENSQDSPSPPATGPATTSPTNTPATQAPGAFPFPGEAPAATPSAPATPGAFPFPGEPAADPANPLTSSSSSSSSDGPSDPGQPALKDEGSAGSTRFSRKKLPKVTIVDPDERESRDLEVSHYYFTTGNFEASYLRAKDAVANIPDDPAAHLALAEAAVHLSKPAEALAEYNAVLKLDPTEQQAKAAHKGLAEVATARPDPPSPK